MEQGAGGSLILGLIMLGVLLALYFAPAIIANSRGRDGAGMITVLNLFLGWTVIGWCVLLIVAFTGDNAHAQRQKAEQLALMRQMAATKTD